MTLLARADNLVGRIAEYEEIKKLAREADGLRTRANQLQTAAKELGRVREQQVALRANDIIPERDGTSSLALAARAKELLSAFRDDRTAILTVQPPLDHSFLKPIKLVCERGDVACANAWKNTAIGILGSLPDDLLNVLEGIASFASGVRKIRALHREGLGIATTMPASCADAVAGALARLREIAKQKSEALETLIGGGGSGPGADIPPEVLRFLSRAAVREARLSEVTPAIVKWLTARGLLNAFRVSPS